MVGSRTAAVLWSVASKTCSIQLAAFFFSIHLVIIHVVHPYSSIDMTAAWKKLRFILLDRSDFHMTDSLPIAIHAFAIHVLMSFLIDETLFPR